MLLLFDSWWSAHGFFADSIKKIKPDLQNINNVKERRRLGAKAFYIVKSPRRLYFFKSVKRLRARDSRFHGEYFLLGKKVFGVSYYNVIYNNNFLAKKSLEICAEHREPNSSPSIRDVSKELAFLVTSQSRLLKISRDSVNLKVRPLRSRAVF